MSIEHIYIYIALKGLRVVMHTRVRIDFDKNKRIYASSNVPRDSDILSVQGQFHNCHFVVWYFRYFTPFSFDLRDLKRYSKFESIFKI